MGASYIVLNEIAVVHFNASNEGGGLYVNQQIPSASSDYQ